MLLATVSIVALAAINNPGQRNERIPGESACASQLVAQRTTAPSTLEPNSPGSLDRNPTTVPVINRNPEPATIFSPNGLTICCPDLECCPKNKDKDKDKD